jgi:small subunit ribosomal protein S6
MAKDPIIYDLVLLLSNNVDDERKQQILTNVQAAIERGGGSVSRSDEWGTRPLPYRIDHQHEAEYRLLQFSSPPTLIESLSHDLGITDGVLRHRIIKNLPGTPAAPDSPPPVVVQAVAEPAGAAAASAASAASDS